MMPFLFWQWRKYVLDSFLELCVMPLPCSNRQMVMKSRPIVCLLRIMSITTAGYLSFDNWDSKIGSKYQIAQLFTVHWAIAEV